MKTAVLSKQNVTYKLEKQTFLLEDLQYTSKGQPYLSIWLRIFQQSLNVLIALFLIVVMRVTFQNNPSRLNGKYFYSILRGLSAIYKVKTYNKFHCSFQSILVRKLTLSNYSFFVFVKLYKIHQSHRDTTRKLATKAVRKHLLSSNSN